MNYESSSVFSAAAAESIDPRNLKNVAGSLVSYVGRDRLWSLRLRFAPFSPSWIVARADWIVLREGTYFAG